MDDIGVYYYHYHIEPSSKADNGIYVNSKAEKAMFMNHGSAFAGAAVSTLLYTTCGVNSRERRPFISFNGLQG